MIRCVTICADNVLQSSNSVLWKSGAYLVANFQKVQCIHSGGQTRRTPRDPSVKHGGVQDSTHS